MRPFVLVLVLVVVVVLVVAAVVLLARRRTSTPDQHASRSTPTLAPMTGLESALNQVTDRDGRSLKEHLDDEAGHIDELRVPDDTGPLLRRALDHVAPPEAGGDVPPEPPAAAT